MKHLLTFALSLWMALTVAANPLVLLSGGVTGGGGGVTYLVDENFEGTGAPANWTGSGGTPNYDYTTSPIEGAQSLNNGGGGVSAIVSFTAQSTAYATFQFRLGSIPGSTQGVAGFRAADTATRALMFVQGTTGELGISAGGGTTYTTDAITAGVNYYVRIEWNASGACSLEFSTTGTFTGSGTKYATRTGGTGTASQFVVGSQNTVLDTLKIAVTPIP